MADKKRPTRSNEPKAPLRAEELRADAARAVQVANGEKQPIRGGIVLPRQRLLTLRDRDTSQSTARDDFEFGKKRTRRAELAAVSPPVVSGNIDDVPPVGPVTTKWLLPDNVLDPQIAVSAEHVVVTTGSNISIFDKQGKQLKTTYAPAFIDPLK